MSLKAATAGAFGYAGDETVCLLAVHLEIEVTTLTAASSAGRFSGELHPQIGSLAELEIRETSVKTLSGHDLVILVLPHGHSVALAEELDASEDGALVLGCIADHRLVKAEDWAKYYRGEFSSAQTYGMPELIHAREPPARAQRGPLTATRGITAPRCDVTTVTLTLQPAVHAGLIDVSYIVVALAIGYSSAGKSTKPRLFVSQVLGNMAPYAVGGTHRHIPEIIQSLVLIGEDKELMRLSFTPILVPTSHRILATIVAPFAEGVEEESVGEAYTIYEDEALITVTPGGVWSTNGPAMGAGPAQVEAVIDAKAGMPIVIAAIDSLGRGTAAAVVQSVNIALGLEEYLGVPMIGAAL